MTNSCLERKTRRIFIKIEHNFTNYIRQKDSDFPKRRKIIWENFFARLKNKLPYFHFTFEEYSVIKMKKAIFNSMGFSLFQRQTFPFVWQSRLFFSPS